MDDVIVLGLTLANVIIVGDTEPELIVIVMRLFEEITILKVFQIAGEIEVEDNRIEFVGPKIEDALKLVWAGKNKERNKNNGYIHLRMNTNFRKLQKES